MYYTSAQSTNNFKPFEIGYLRHIIISNDSPTEELSFNFDGGTLEMTLSKSETIEFNWVYERTIYIKDKVTGTHIPFRIWAW